LAQAGTPRHLRNLQIEATDDEDWGVAGDEMTDAQALLEMGQAWYQDTDEAAREEFHDLAEEMLATGQAEQVAEVCQQLIGEAGICDAVPIWSAWSLRAQEEMRRTHPQDISSPVALTPPDRGSQQGAGADAPS